jgi:hypothetical protein
MTTNRTRLGLAISALAVAACLSSLAVAQTPNDNTAPRPQCSGEHGQQTDADHADHAARLAERFKKMDKNGDGFLTQDEVGPERWAHIQVADANKDGKISLAELQQAHADGKLGHDHHGQPPA